MRRGQAELLEWFPRIMLMLVAMIISIMLVRTFTDRSSDSPDTSRAVYVYRLVYSDLLMQHDPVTGRVTVGVVDLDKIDENTIANVFSVDDRRSSKVMITGCGLSEILYQNKDAYETQAPFFTITSGSTREDRVFPVTVKKGNQFCPGTLNISVVRR